MFQRNSEAIIERLKSQFMPEGFLEQYARAEGLPVGLGNAGVEEVLPGLYSVMFPLVIGEKEAHERIYALQVRDLYGYEPAVAAVSFSGKHPMIEAPLVQLLAEKDGMSFFRKDGWIDDGVVFPEIRGYNMPYEAEQELQPQPEIQRKRVAVATLSETYGQQLDDILRGF